MTTTFERELYLDHLRHMLGAGKDKKRSLHGTRNHFCAEIGTKDYRDLCMMESLGLVEFGHIINMGRDQYFHATRAGADAIQLSKAATKRVFN